MSEDGLLERLDRIEAALARLAPAGALAERLHDPIAPILDRMDALEATVRALATFVERAPIVADLVAGTAVELSRRAEARGIDLVARAEAGLAFAETATDPALLAALGAMAKDVPKLAPLAGRAAEPAALAAAEALLHHAPTAARLAEKVMAPAAVQVAETLLDRADAAGRLVERATSPASLALAERLIDAVGAQEVTALLDAGLDKRTLGLLVRTARAAAEAPSSAAPLGPFGTLRSLSDPDVMRATGLLIAFAKKLGQALDQPLTAGR